MLAEKGDLVGGSSDRVLSYARVRRRRVWPAFVIAAVLCIAFILFGVIWFGSFGYFGYAQIDDMRFRDYGCFTYLTVTDIHGRIIDWEVHPAALAYTIALTVGIVIGVFVLVRGLIRKFWSAEK